MKNTPPDEKVWQFIHQCADIHSYRSDYAVAIYKAHARKISEIPFDRVNKGTGKDIRATSTLAAKMKRVRS